MIDIETKKDIETTFDFLKKNYDREILRAIRTGKIENLNQANNYRYEINGFITGLLSAGIERSEITSLTEWNKKFYD